MSSSRVIGEKNKIEGVGMGSLVSQQGDGVYGSLTVRGPRDNASLERILVLSSRSPTPLTQQTLLYPPTPDKLLVNGQVYIYTLHHYHY